jgi:hypothetical protein
LANDLKVLMTSGRFPAAAGLVSALHKGGARVDAVDSYKLAPALHAHQVAQIHVVPGPVGDPLAYVRAVVDIVGDRGIDLITPTFEEGFYLARYRDLLPVPLFAPTFAAIRDLHSKARFVALCKELGLPAPETQVVPDLASLRGAIGGFSHYVARPAFSRGGTTYLTNHGPRAGELAVEDCTPTEQNPWLVQAYVDGRDACSFSIVRDGKVLVHCAYGISISSPSGWSVQFESIDDFGTLDVTARVAERYRYTGFIGFDCRLTTDGFVMIECNPRTSAGLFLTPREWIAEAVLGGLSALRTVPPGVKRQYDADLVAAGVTGLPVRERLRALLTVPDAFVAEHELLPALLRYTAAYHWTPIAQREHVGVDTAFLADMSWNGEPMPDLDGADAVAAARTAP